MLHVLASQRRQRRRRLLQPLLVLELLCLGQIAALSLPNGTMLSGNDGNAVGNVNLPTLGGAGLGIVNGSLGSGGVNSGSASSPGGGGSGGSSGSQSNQELNAGGNTLGAGAGGSGPGGGAGAAGSSNNSALLQAPKEKQYERCTGPGDPGPCKQYIYKWRYEPSTSECTTFIWGGCDGNPHNRFSTEAECLYHCIGGPRKRIIVVSQESISYQKCAFPFPSLLLSPSADTLPPFLQSTTREPSTTESSLASYTPSPAQLPVGYGGAGGGAGGGGYGGGGYGSGTTPVPIEQRGPELTFAETGQDKTFVFAKNNTFIQMDGDIIQTFQLR